jgi:hypothetical protein
MADYLNNLIAKNLSLQENLQPRLPSRFEPPAETLAVADIGDIAPPVEKPDAPASPLTAPDELRSQTRPSPQTTPTAPVLPLEQRLAAPKPIEPDPAPAPEPYRGRLDAPKMNPPGPDSSPVKPGQSEKQPVTTIIQSVKEVKDVIGPSAPVTTEVVPANEPVRSYHSSDLGAEQVREVVIEQRSEHVLVPNTIKTAEQEPSPEKPKPATQSRPVVPAPTPAPTPPSQDLRPVVPPLPDLAPRSAPPEPSPTINVSIGRVEVRATAPPANPARKPTPAPQIMSLDEYLQSRSNGERS